VNGEPGAVSRARSPLTDHRSPGAEPSSATATLYILLAACAFGSVTIFTVIATRAGASLLSVLVWRYLLGGALLVLAAGGLRRVMVPRRKMLQLLIVAGGGQAFVAATSLYALRYLTAGTLAFLFYTYPAWIALLSAARGWEKIDGRKLVALGLSLAGIFVMVGSPTSASLHPVGLALALGSALAYAAYVPMLGRMRAGLDPAAASAWLTIGATIWFLVAAAAGSATLDALGLPPDPWLAVSARLTTTAWLAILGLALFSTMIAFIVFLRGLAVLGPVRTSIVSTVEPFYTSLAGALLLAQPITGTTLAGGTLIAIAVVVLSRRG
jgi:drug/metabolite transporter (DMT)-like permease